MKRIIVVALVLTCALLLFACSGSVTAISAKSAEYKVALGNTVDLASFFEIEGKGTVDYAVSPIDVLVPSGKSWVAAKEGSCAVTAYAGELSATVTVNVVNDKKLVVNLSDATFVYDGTVKNLSLDMNLPAGTTVEYRLGGAVFTGTTEPGEYEVTVDVIAPRSYTVEYERRTAVLTIRKKTLVLDDIRFRSRTVTYDGTEKILSVEGTLPDGVTATIKYTDSDGNPVAHVIDAGVYDAKVTFVVDERYYDDPPTMSARLTVQKQSLVDGNLDDTKLLRYDATDHFPALTLPESVTAEYYVLTTSAPEGQEGEDYVFDKGSVYVKKTRYYQECAAASRRAFVDIGQYTVLALLTVDPALSKNYSAPEKAMIIVQIDKADFVYDLSWREPSLVYTGETYTLGYGDYTLGLYGTLPHGVGGEFSEGVSVTFVSNGTSAATQQYVDAGRYSVVARFSFPSAIYERYSQNYNALPELNYTVIIQKAPYGISFDFEPIDQNQVDFSSRRFYDGDTHTFALKFASDADKTTFLGDCNLKYYLRKDSGARLLCEGDPSVLHAGTYTISYEVSFKNNDLVKNFTPPENGSFDVIIDKIVFDMRETRFDSDSVVYDGLSHTLTPTKVPVGVEYYLVGGDKTDAGSYTVRATFSATGIPAQDCLLQGNTGAVSSVTATLTITKATYSDHPVFTVDVAQYSPTATLADRPILYNDETTALARWKDSSLTPTVGSSYYALYNADPTNFFDYEFVLSVPTTKVTLDAALFSVDEQFIAFTGYRAVPKYSYDGAAVSATAYALHFTCEDCDDVQSLGTHRLTDLSIELVDTVNYELTGSSALADVDIHIYNGNHFEYEGLQLKKYKAFGNSVEVPEGTRSIYHEAFKGKSTSNLILPSSLTSLSTSALAGMDNLTKLTLPFIGSTPGGVLNSIFGGAIPATLSEITVTEETTIAENAYRDCATITTITYENPVVSVGNNAFYGCTLLERMSLPAVASLGSSVFYHCTGLETLTLPFIGASSFTQTIAYLIGDSNADFNPYGSYRLATLDLSCGTFTTVPAGAFSGLTSLQEVFLPDTAVHYESKAFTGTAAEIHLPATLTSLDDGAFWGYTGTSVDLPSNLTTIGNDAFRSAGSILIYIPQKVTSLGERAFYGVSQVSFADSPYLTRIGDRAFFGYAATTISLPNTVAEIGDYAFSQSALVSINTGATLGDYVFADCVNLQSATLTGAAVPEGTFKGCTSLSSVSIPNATVIEKEAFKGCESLPSLTLSDGVTEIGNEAFSGCSEIGFINLFATAVPVFGTNALATGEAFDLYVPAASVSAYSAALSSYANVNVRAAS